MLIFTRAKVLISGNSFPVRFQTLSTNLSCHDGQGAVGLRPVTTSTTGTFLATPGERRSWRVLRD